jgi:phosphinothricin acetyltransferase
MIDPTAFIAPGAVVLGEVRLGRDTSVWYQTVIRGDTERIVVGDETNLQDLTVVHADPGFPCLVGDRVTVGHRAILHGCIVEDECMIGMGSILLNGVRVGSGSIVGAGAVLAEGMQVPPGSLVLGVPGKVMRPVDPTLRGRIEHAWRHYVAEAGRHRSGAFPIVPPSAPISGLNHHRRAAGPSEGLTIEAMTPSDWEVVRAIYAEGIATGEATFETDAPDWESWDHGRRPDCRLVARSGEIVLGWAALSPVSARPVYAGVAEASLYVAASARGRGVGKALLRALIESSERAGVWTLQGSIFPENAASLGLVATCGFRVVGRRERIGRRDDVWRDTILVERRSKAIGLDEAMSGPR